MSASTTAETRKNKRASIVIVSAMVCTRNLIEAEAIVKQRHSDVFDLSILFVTDIDAGHVSASKFSSIVHDADILLLDIRGNDLATEIIVDTINRMERDENALFKAKTIVSLVGGNEEIRRLTKLGSFMARSIPSKKSIDLGMDNIPDITDLVKKGIKIGQVMKSAGKYLPFGALKHSRNWVLLIDYWVFGHAGVRENLVHMFELLLKDYLGHKGFDVPEPQKFPPLGIYDPRVDQYFSSLAEYHQAQPADPNMQTIGIFFYGGIYFEQTLPVVECLIDNLDGYNIIPVFSEALYNIDAQEQFFFTNGKPIISAVINLQYFQINGGPFGGNNALTLDLYKRANVPQFNPIILFDTNIDHYLSSTKGTIPINQVIAVVMPELDGRIEMLAAGAMQSQGQSPGSDVPVLEVEPIEENIRLIAARVKKWLALRAKPNSEKKIAIILYDYPPGEEKLASASYLDVPSSVNQLLDMLSREGYIVDKIPPGKGIQDLLIEAGAINSPRLVDVKNFKGVAIDAASYTTLLSNLPQTTRDRASDAWGPPPGMIMVKGSQVRLPILQFGNAFICLQPARSEVSGDPNEYHDKDKPPHHQYIAMYRYLDEMLDVDAVIHFGTHGTIEFLPGKECIGHAWDDNIALIGRIPNIYLYHVSNTSEAAIAKRRSNAVIVNHAGPAFEAYATSPNLQALEDLLNEAHDPRLAKEIEQQDLEARIKTSAESAGIEFSTMEDLEASIQRLKLAAVPIGLHVLGSTFTPTEKESIIARALVDAADVPDVVDVIVREAAGDDQFVARELSAIVHEILASNDSPKETRQRLDMLARHSKVRPNDIDLLVVWVQDLSTRIAGSLELRNLTIALEGGFIEPGFGGDPIRTPSIFPTGRNSYGFDPRLIPSSIAFARGGEIATRLLAQYKSEHGTWPETTSVVLWGFETMKTGGETVGQIFNYIGVRSVKKKSVWTTELEAIPLHELGHPRINVVVSICGIFRDTFPYILDLINRAVDLVAGLDEPIDQNFIKKVTQDLEASNATAPAARIFGPSPGRYNTNITEIIGAGTWKDEAELANNFLDTMSFAYLKNQEVLPAKASFTAQVARVELLSQVRDSTEFHVTDLDHYYEFTGGLARAREHVTGSTASVYIADTSRKRIHIDSLASSINEGAVTRTLNRHWIQGMLEHKHSGGQKVAERIENFLGMAATTHQVRDWVWEKAYSQYIEDEEIKNAMIDNNRFAMMDVIKTMLQAAHRGYWDASDEQVDMLKKIYLDLDSWVEMSYQG